MNIEKLIEILRKENIPTFGIAPAELMDNEEIGFRPKDVLPSAKTVLCFGLQIPDSIYQLRDNKTEMIWRAQNLLYRKLDSISLLISSIVEQEGFEAVPTIGCIPLTMNSSRQIVGYINQIKMAELVGIGFIGKNGMLVNDQFGPRLMLGGIITSAEMQRMCFPINKRNKCPEECMICIDNCPVKAIERTTKKVNSMKCLSYTARINSFSKIIYGMFLLTNRKRAIRYLNTKSFDEHTFHICSECVIRCPMGKSEGRKRSDNIK